MSPLPKGVALAPGMRVLCRDAEWLVTRVDASNYGNTEFAIHCVGSDDLVRGHESIFLTQLDSIEPIDPRATDLIPDDSHGYRKAKLFLEAQLRQMPLTDTEPHVDGIGAFQPMGYQREAVHRALLQMRPRLLLADAVGLGKTIEVGMILSELMRRGRADRILVLAKKSMLTQFQAELWNRFAIPLVRLDSVGIGKLRLRIPASKNPFEVYHRIIISIDTLKDVGRYRHFLEDTRWDVVVIDEAHNVAGASVPDRHLSHRLARLLSRKTDSLILTTATPHNGKKETFGRLISLLDPSAIPDPRLRDYTAEDMSPFFLMRFKEDVRHEAGDNFCERVVTPLAQTTADATPGEEEVYKALADLRDAVRQGAIDGGKPDSLVQWGLYKRFLSSPEACLSTVERRISRLETSDPDGPELPLLDSLRESLMGLALRSSSRYQLLKKELQAIGWDGSPRSPRVLLFTESTVTQKALAEALAKDFGIPYSPKFEDQESQVLATIHGGFPDVSLARTVEAFGTGSRPLRLLVATDVASEGVNLHHECHNIIHYDLPWSIITLIQRNGRIDRFGQRKNPVLRYLMVNTREGLLTGDRAIFDRLIAKVEEINRSTRTGESVLCLYDPEAEEEYIATQGILGGDVGVLDRPAAGVEGAGSEATALEAELLRANQLGHDEFMSFLLGEAPTGPAAQASGKEKPADPSRIRLYGNKEFLKEGYNHLAATDGGRRLQYQPLEETGEQLILTAPPDLRRRLGAPDGCTDVVFGATAIPEEAWPETGQFHLTASAERVNLAIQAALATNGQWARETLCSELHPILRWVAERLVMLLPRGAAPVILSRGLPPGELCFCFIGQVSSLTGIPLVVDAHAISFSKGGGFAHRPLTEALERAQFQRLSNTGQAPNLMAAKTLVPAAVEASLAHLREHKEERKQELKPRLEKEERRLRTWYGKRRSHLEGLLRELPAGGRTAKSYRTELEEMEGYLKDRELNWRQAHFEAADEPTTRLVLVIEGVS